MITCSLCGVHTREGACHSCGATVTASGPPRASFLLLGLALGGCGTGAALYGAAISDRMDTTGETGGVDADHDGFYAETSGGADCNDDNADINPDAVETTGDQVDSNCDGEDDT